MDICWINKEVWLIPGESKEAETDMSMLFTGSVGLR